MTSATAEPIADLGDGKVKIADADPALKDVLQGWYEQASKILTTLRAPAFLLREVQESAGWTPPSKLDTAVEIIGQCIAGIESLDDEIASGAYGHFVIEAEPDTAISSASKTGTTLNKRTQQACNATSLVRAARIISEKLELGGAGDELALTEVLHSAERAVNELFGEIHAAAEAVGAKSDDS